MTPREREGVAAAGTTTKDGKKLAVHTPGPYRIEEAPFGLSWRVLKDYTSPELGNLTACIANVFGAAGNEKQAEPNARLFAASVELLAYVKELARRGDGDAMHLLANLGFDWPPLHDFNVCEKRSEAEIFGASGTLGSSL